MLQIQLSLLNVEKFVLCMLVSVSYIERFLKRTRYGSGTFLLTSCSQQKATAMKPIHEAKAGKRAIIMTCIQQPH